MKVLLIAKIVAAPVIIREYLHEPSMFDDESTILLVIYYRVLAKEWESSAAPLYKSYIFSDVVIFN